MKRIEALIFDIDGTIIHLPVDWDRVLDKLKNFGIVNAKSFLGILAKYYGTPLFIEINRIVEEEEVKALNRLVVLDNADAHLRRLYTKYRLCFVTMQSQRVAEEILKRLGLERDSYILITRENAATRIAQLSKAIESLNVEKDRVIFIGDKILDAIAAAINGIRAVIVMREMSTTKISSTDDIEEDLEVLGIPIARDLYTALKHFNIDM